MPAVTMRLLEALALIMEFATDEEQTCVLMRQAEMLLRSSESRSRSRSTAGTSGTASGEVVAANAFGEGSLRLC